MGSELSARRDHLGQHRRMIIGRSLAAAAVGSLPIPLVEEWLASRIQRGTIRRIAERRGVDLDEAALRAIADGPSSPPEWLELAGGTLVSRVAARSLRRVVWAYVIARRARAAARSFLIATMFDHYCSRLHVGLGLDAAAGVELRGAMERALAATPGGIARRAFGRGAIAAARATARAPLALANAATGGWLRKKLGGAGEVSAVAEVDGAIERQLAESDSVLSRSVAAIEAQLTAEANPYLDQLLDGFERSWRRREGDGESES
jgi:uncharacterized protein (DUF697 family)